MLAAIQARGEVGAEDSLRVARWLLDAGEPMAPTLLADAARAANLSGDPDLGAELAARALDSGAGVEAALLLARAHTVRDRLEDAEQVLIRAEPSIQTQEEALDFLEQQAEVLYWE